MGKYKDLNCCPRCGSTNIDTYAFSLSEDAGIVCNDCDFTVEKEIPWEDLDAGVPEDHPDYTRRLIAAHDKKAYETLRKMWNGIKPDPNAKSILIYEDED